MTAAIRRGYPVLIAFCLALTLAGCATTAAKLPPEVPAMHTVAEFSDDEYIARIDDPWEGFNRSMYKFNYNFDKYIFLPVVNGYEFITPTFVQTGVSNFFKNLGEIPTLYNSLFQAKGGKSLTTLGRFLTNSTIGLAGLFDPATSLGLKRQQEDFGQTLGVWGAGTGPYVVLPILGPNTVRSTTGFAVDSGIHFGIVTAIDPFPNSDYTTPVETGIYALEAVDQRHRQKFRYCESGYPFEYSMVRFLFTEKQELAVMK
jgi:phospholipid-binding lipoprotein MlaA